MGFVRGKLFLVSKILVYDDKDFRLAYFLNLLLCRFRILWAEHLEKSTPCSSKNERGGDFGLHSKDAG